MSATEIGWGLAAVITGALLTGWGALTRTRLGWACLASSFLPIVIMTIVSGPELPTMSSRMILSAITGAIFGALFLIGAVEALHTHANAQTSDHNAVKNETPAVPTVPNGATGNFNFSQQGGTTNQTYVNQAAPKLTFTAELGANLLSMIPKTKPVRVQATGSLSDQQVGQDIAQFLSQKGYQVELILIGMLIPAPDRALNWNAESSTLTVAPSAW